MKKKKVLRISILLLCALALAAPFSISAYMKASTDQYLVSDEAAKKLGADCILVLGAGLKPDGTPNNMLQDRLDKGIELYQEGAAPKILLSGDNGQVEYDEVNAMKDYVLKAGDTV